MSACSGLATHTAHKTHTTQIGTHTRTLQKNPQVDAVKAKALETILILHMDHEQNASTSTVRTAGSSQANPFACVASGIAALWGPAHGGANEAVLKMLEVRLFDEILNCTGFLAHIASRVSGNTRFVSLCCLAFNQAYLLPLFRLQLCC